MVDKRIFVASSTPNGDPLSFISLDRDTLILRGFYKMNQLDSIDLTNITDKKDFFRWSGFSNDVAKSLGYKNSLALKFDFLYILKKLIN